MLAVSSDGLYSGLYVVCSRVGGIVLGSRQMARAKGQGVRAS